MITLVISYLRGDIPPTIRGRTLTLQVEFRSAPSADSPHRTMDDYFQIRSVTKVNPTCRASRNGPIRWEQLRREEDRWVLPCEAEVFTQRGTRVVTISLAGKDESFIVPLAARPGESDTTWSDWLPRQRRDGGPAINTLTFRYRVALDEPEARAQPEREEPGVSDGEPDVPLATHAAAGAGS